MRVELELCDDEGAHIVKNLWPLYLHDVSEFDPSLPNRHGILGARDDVTTVAAQGELQNGWWKADGALFPYLVRVDGRPAGFDLIAARPRFPAEIEADFVVHEFFVLHAYRGRGVAERAAVLGLDRHRGRWEIVTYPSHGRAIAFWRKVVGNYADGHEEREVDHPWGRKVAFRFDNSRRPLSAPGERARDR